MGAGEHRVPAAPALRPHVWNGSDNDTRTTTESQGLGTIGGAESGDTWPVCGRPTGEGAASLR